jgi:hypothetical protein
MQRREAWMKFEKELEDYKRKKAEREIEERAEKEKDQGTTSAKIQELIEELGATPGLDETQRSPTNCSKMEEQSKNSTKKWRIKSNEYKETSI